MTGRFVNGLRIGGQTVRLAPENAATPWTVRVQAAEAWNAVGVTVEPSMSVRQVKQAAMATLMPDASDVDGYVVKLRGFEITDESVSLQTAGALDGSTFLVVSRRRRPVR